MMTSWCKQREISNQTKIRSIMRTKTSLEKRYDSTVMERAINRIGST